jgi:hypothetical protein
MKILFFILLVVSSSLFAAPEQVIFKIIPAAYNPGDPIRKEFKFSWYGQELGEKDEKHLLLSIRLNSAKIDDVWLWQTYRIFNPQDFSLISPKLPKGCECFDVSFNWSDNYFHMAVYFFGKPCKSVIKAAKTEKIHIRYRNIVVVDENRIVPELDFYIDDLPEHIWAF